MCIRDRAMMGQTALKKNEVVTASVSKRLVSSLRHKEYVRVKVGKVGDKMVAAPPVSYTHLDVYKRQKMKRECRLSLPS